MKELYFSDYNINGYSATFSMIISLDTADGITNKFKLTHHSDNCYSHNYIYLMSPNGWQLIASDVDFKDNICVNYISDEDKKRAQMKAILAIEKNWINKCF